MVRGGLDGAGLRIRRTHVRVTRVPTAPVHTHLRPTSLRRFVGAGPLADIVYAQNATCMTTPEIPFSQWKPFDVRRGKEMVGGRVGSLVSRRASLARVTVGIAACIVSHARKRDSDPCAKEVSWL